MKMLLLIQEVALLQNFESKDVALAFKLNKSQTEKAEVVAAVNDCQLKLAAKKKVSIRINYGWGNHSQCLLITVILSLCRDLQEVESWQGKEAAVQKEFLELVPPSSQFHSVLSKIFRRKIKRTKKVRGRPALRGLYMFLFDLAMHDIFCRRNQGRTAKKMMKKRKKRRMMITMTMKIWMRTRKGLMIPVLLVVTLLSTKKSSCYARDA